MNTKPKRAFVPFGSFDVEESGYILLDGEGSVAREYDTQTPVGNPMAGRWAYRDGEGVLIDFDRYRHDLLERNNIKLV